MKQIDINCDLGESNDEVAFRKELDILSYISSASISCAAHSGKEEYISNLIHSCKNRGVRIGAHPSYPDRENFGRKTLDISIDELKDSLLTQLEFIHRIASLHQAEISYIKPHGALYHEVMKGEDVTQLFIDLITAKYSNLSLMLMPESSGTTILSKAGIEIIREGFIDRKYQNDHSLVNRQEADALLNTANAVKQAIDMCIQGSVNSKEGPFKAEVDSLCVHGDSPNSLELLKALHKEIEYHHITVSHGIQR